MVKPSKSQATGVDLRDLFTQNYASIWRLLKRLGVRDADLDDAAQEVFWVAARRLADIQLGSEQAFLYGVALRVASGERKKLRNPSAPIWDVEQAEPLVCERRGPEQLLEERQRLQLLDSVLDQMQPSLRSIFVLYELEGLEVKQVAELQGIPIGTASSRLRRARAEFSAVCRRIRAVQRRTNR